MTILVTGANGFVGRWVVRALLAAGHTVIGASGPEGAAGQLDDAERRQVEWMPLDLEDARTVERLAAKSVDAVIHLAGYASGAQALKNPEAAWNVNAVGTGRLCEAFGAAKTRGASDPVILVASTAEVYAPQARPHVEADPLGPLSPYAASKRGAEVAALETARRTGLKTIVARAFPHTGPGQDDRFVAPAFAKRLRAAAAMKAPAVKTGNLEVVRDFLDVRDVAAAYLALVGKGTPGEVYNVASGTGVTLAELFAGLARVIGVRAIPEPDPSLLRPADIPVLIGDATKLRNATGWSPRIPFDTTLKDLVDAQAH